MGSLESSAISIHLESPRVEETQVQKKKKQKLKLRNSLTQPKMKMEKK